jgi:Glycosyl hydrolase family 26
MLTLAGCGVFGHPAGRALPSAGVTATPKRTPAAPVASSKPLVSSQGAAAFVLGVFEPDETSYQQIGEFGNAVGRQPNVVLQFSDWGSPFPETLAAMLRVHGAESLIQLEPSGISLASIADGSDDWYLKSYAEQLRDFGSPVILSFAPEPNGNWYPWGWTRLPPSVYVAAWQHVVSSLRSYGATNVTWLWTANVTYPGAGPLADYWPGDAYVDWVGIDGYFTMAGDTFSSLFMPTITALRAFTAKPILLSETAVGPVAGQIQTIPGIFAGIQNNRLLGLVWFDEAQDDGIYHQDWRLEDDPAGIDVFRQGLAASG